MNRHTLPRIAILLAVLLAACAELPVAPSAPQAPAETAVIEATAAPEVATDAPAQQLATTPADQTVWVQLPEIDSPTSPAIATLGFQEGALRHFVGRVFVAAIAHTGYVAYTSTSSPGTW